MSERPDAAVNVVLLTALVAYGPMSTDLYLPSLPALTAALGTDVSLAQLTLSVFMAGFAVAQLVYGPLSDRFGRRSVLLGGLGLYVLASLLCALAPRIEALIAARFLQALGACAGPVLGRAIVRDIYGRERAARALSYMASAMALVPAAAPILGGWLQAWFGWRANFVALTLFGIGTLGISWAVLQETNRWRDPHAVNPRRLLRNYALLARQRRYGGYTLAVAAAFAGLFSFISGAPFVLIETLGLAPTAFGYAFAVVIAGFITGTYLSGRYAQRAGSDRLILAGVLLAVIAGLLLAALAWAGVTRTWAVLAPSSLYFLASGLVLPNAMAGAIGPFPTMAGTASALLGFAQTAAAALAGYLVGLLHDLTTRPMASIMLVLALLGALAYITMVWLPGPEPETPPTPH